MNVSLLKALVALAPASVLLLGSIVLFFRDRTLSVFLQIAGAASLVMVVMAHISEALHWFPAMNWGLEHSAGHYFDLACAAAGITLFPVGYLLHALQRRRG